jgi:hypothetical protein
MGGMRALLAAASLACAAASAAAAPAWHALPGTDGAEVDLASAHVQGAGVQAWLRFAGEARQAGRLLTGGAVTPAAHRSAVHAHVDCRQRTVRVHAVQSFNNRGTLIGTASLPGVAQALPDDGTLALVRDALCELARAPRAG